ncbi:MAG: Ig-like domain-containing protein [Treponema sp.]|nr:Ig-like domain-containing protein [Treponema sp.]
MAKKCLVVLAVLVFVCGSLWAGGSKEVNRIAEDPAGFTDTIDTSKRKPGKYNYYLAATDKAGNVTLSGPENIFIDPVSDLPNVTIINPSPMMHVQGNMNIVGIAFDDDGVDLVELTVHRGTDGKGEELVRTRASGKDYWSYFLNTSNQDIWTDGDYTVTAWGTDITGISGIASEFANGARVKPKQHKKAVVYWTLDRKKPEIAITSHETGALVSGNVHLRGTAVDGNGISSFRYSTDGGKSYQSAKVSLNKRTGEYTWDVNIKTNTLEDGPQVIWFQAEDGKKSLGTAAHLLFVNNTGPDVKIVYPEQNAVVNGVFGIAGYAKHPVGLKSISWKAGNFAGGTFDLLEGNDWWSAEVDLRRQKASSVDIEIRAEDVSGNVTIKRQKYKVNAAADLPIVKLTTPVPGILNSDFGIMVSGTVSDDDGTAAIFWSLNGQEAVEIPSSDNFQFRIPPVREGTHSIDVWAKDINGVIGPKVQVKGIIVPPSSPVPSIINITVGKSTMPFYSGMMIRPIPIMNQRTGTQLGVEKMSMSVGFRGSAAPATAYVAIGDNLPIPLRLSGSGTMFTATVPFPDNLPNGSTRITFTATDRQGRDISLEEFVFYNTLPNDGSSLPFQFEWARTNRFNDGRVLLGDPEDVVYGVASAEIRNVTVSGTGSGNVRAEVDEKGRVVLRATSEGEAGPLTLNLQTDAGTRQSSPIRIVADFSGPRITMSGTNYGWTRNTANIRFNVTSRNRVSAVEYSLDLGETWRSFGAVSTDYSRSIDLTGIDDGAVCILIRATNDSGKFTVEDFTVLKDTQAPAAELIMPIAEASVNGTIRLAFNIKEIGELSTITYNRPARSGSAAITREVFNASSWYFDYAPRFIEVLMDSLQMPLDSGMRFTFTDRAGNSTDVSSWQFLIDQQADVPVVQVILPQENEVITNDFLVSGVMFDDDGIKNVQYRIDSGAWQTIDAKNGFSFPVSLFSLTDNAHTITVIAEDIYGVRSQPVTRNFRVSLSEPAATMTYPQVDTILKGGVELRGSSSDRNGIKSIHVSVDNGTTFNPVRGSFGSANETVPWTYQFNTTILKDGNHVVFLKVVDRYDVPATYVNMINVDNTAPEIILDSPIDGSRSTGQLSVMGRILDPNLSDVEIQIRGLEGQSIPNDIRSRKIAPNIMLRENYNVANLQDGYYDITVIGKDSAGNESRLSRNVELARRSYQNTIEILYPLENEAVSGTFNLYGVTDGADKAADVTIRVNGRDMDTADVDDNGYFRFTLNSEHLNDGSNTVLVRSNFGTSTMVQTRTYNINYSSAGPWVTIDSFTFGDFAYDRPYFYGRNGYALNEDDIAALADKKTNRAEKARIKAKAPNYTEISFDNGKTFTRTLGKQGKNIDYRYRIETGLMPEGLHYIVVRTWFKNGENAVSRMMVSIDKTFPEIRLISPGMGERYNQEIPYSASATDDVELVSLTYHLRPGDKSMYAVPGFLQGLYFEAIIPPYWKMLFPDNPHVPSFPFGGGATFMDVAMGLSFFDDNVKVQFNYGFMTQELYDMMGGKGDVRYGGHVIGIKLLANIYTLPFLGIFGPDFEWLYASFAVGANFSLFDIMKEGYTQSGESTWMAALLLQIEFPKVILPKKKYFRQFSFFTEGQLWFVPTDVNAKQLGIEVVLPKIIIGLRLYVF